MKLMTLDRLDDQWWPQAHRIYDRAFPHGRKPDSVIAAMFDRRMAHLHLLIEDGDDGSELLAMAIAGMTGNLLLIDYVAVREDVRGLGIGGRMVEAIRQWARSDGRTQGIVVEVEAEDNEENRSRIRFWERCGFTLTDYVHRYVWVPETYRAMYAKLDSDSSVPEDGKKLFSHITSYHNRAFRK